MMAASRDAHPIPIAEARDRRAIARVQEGSVAAFGELFGRYGPQAVGLAVRVVGSKPLAEEVVQDVFAAVWQRAGSYDPSRASVRAWLMMQVHHRAVDVVRRERAERGRSVLPANGVFALPGPGDVIEEHWLGARRRQVRAALERLSGEHREILELAYFEGLTQLEVSAKAGIPLGTVKSRTMTALRRLRVMLADGSEG